MAKENRNYKDSVFCDLFYSDETAAQNLLELYNGLFGTDYKDTSLIGKVRLEDVMFRNAKNDVCFTVGNKRIILSEHQSTVNPNMPIRMLLYSAREYEALISQEDRYSSNRIPLMTPSFIVFYNGTQDMPAEQILRLSDSFSEEQDITNGILELSVRVVNINTCKNHPLLASCSMLRQYSMFVERTRCHAGDKKMLEKSVKECIDECILADYLTRKSREVINMLMAEYDYETDLHVHEKEAEARGEARGEIRGELKGKVELCYTDLHMGIREIAARYHIGVPEVEKILTEKKLIPEIV